MRFPSPAVTLFALLLGWAVGACDQGNSNYASSQSPLARIEGLDLRRLAPLGPFRRTHLTVSPADSSIYWAQESTNGDDAMFVMGSDGVPRATQLTAHAICIALDARGGRGNIQSIAFGGDSVYFYFSGGLDRKVLVCLGKYTPATESITILSSPAALMEVSGMGFSIDLARGTLIMTEKSGWLWLRHSDAAYLTRFEIGPNAPFRLVHGSETMQTPRGAIRLMGDDYRLSAGAGDGLLVVDTKLGVLWQLDAYGQATERAQLTGLPSDLSEATWDGQRILIFASPSEPMGPSEANQIVEPPVHLPYPGLLFVNPNGITGVGKDHISGLDDALIGQLKLTAISPNKPAGWIAYDYNSGQLLHVRPLASWER